MSNATAPLALEMTGICKSFFQGHKELHVLKGIDLSVKPGELVALVGASGSGKSTLLQLAGLLDKPTFGTIAIAGERVADLKDDVRSQIRRSKLGFVYQFHHLLPDFSALENVQMALRIGGVDTKTAAKEAEAILVEMGLGDRLSHNPAELSGGEQQRVAIARAIVANPSLLLADEPTGNLDEETAGRVFELFVSMVRNRGLAAVIATHDLSLAGQMDRQLHLSAGVLHES
ncbi:ABC transporter ATP-binding protein [Kordiimonas lacus]|uniref:Lipoprotein-releasing system ATP-binding protein n=1 Tax=Kordiimonas lacus TaxID=637679 RepID=A0A1G6WBF1_9PROT|nr:ABC transporter ATP-binding protein [Kordiimonas lacus]SDD63192.1 lipoprotein-releasing system ATP-binding protein [Kordiimonas lacus]